MDDDKLIPLSYISQFMYCKRRVGLLMLEQQWGESVDTAKGRIEHRNVHSLGSLERNGRRIITDLQIVSHRMGLIGRCDAVEATEDENGNIIPFLDNKRFSLYPVEYKHGKFRNEPEYELQLCAQAMCIEEMYKCTVNSGAIFYVTSHRRKEVLFSDELRCSVEDTSQELAKMLCTQKVPKAVYSPKCVRCSLVDICMPETSESVSSYIRLMSTESRKEVTDEKT